MSFNSINGTGYSQARALPLPRSVDRPSAEQPAIQTRPRLSRFSPDQLSLGESDDFSSLSAGQFRSQVNYQSRLKVQQSENGNTTVKFKSRLNFDYQFQSEDGTTIQISAKIKTKLSVTQNGDQSYDLKSRVKIELSLTQASVQSGLAPLLTEEPGANEQQLSPIASAFQDFANAIDALSNQFAEDGLAGDDLIVSLVDAFNELIQAVSNQLPGQQNSLPAPGEPVPIAPSIPIDNVALDDAIPAGAAPSVPTLTVTDSSVQDSSSVQPAESSSQPPSQPEETPELAAPTAIATSPPEPTPVGEPVSGLALAADGQVAEGQVTDDSIAAQESSAGKLNEVDASSPNNAARRSVLVELRVKFVQSLSQLVSTLDSPTGGDNPALVRSSLQQFSSLNVRLSIYDHNQLLDDQSPGRFVDTLA